MGHVGTPPDEINSGPPFVFGFRFKNGAATQHRWEDVVSGVADYDWTWLHLNMNNEEARIWIRDQSDIPYAAQNALLAGETRPRVTHFENGLVVNLRGVNLNEGANPEDMVSIRIWADERRVISTRRRKLKAAQDVRGEISNGDKRIDSPGALIAKLAARLTSRMTPFVESIEDMVDALESDVINERGEGVRARLAEARQNAVSIRRFIAPQRDALTRLALDDSALFKESTRVDLREVADHVTRLTEEIDAARERAMVLQDQLADQRAEEMNRNMMILSVVAAVFLPLGFITGLFGINVGGMPGVESAAAFWLVVAACGMISVALLVVFKLLEWL